MHFTTLEHAPQSPDCVCHLFSHSSAPTHACVLSGRKLLADSQRYFTPVYSGPFRSREHAPPGSWDRSGQHCLHSSLSCYEQVCMSAAKQRSAACLGHPKVAVSSLNNLPLRAPASHSSDRHASDGDASPPHTLCLPDGQVVVREGCVHRGSKLGLTRGTVTATATARCWTSLTSSPHMTLSGVQATRTWWLWHRVALFRRSSYKGVTETAIPSHPRTRSRPPRDHRRCPSRR